MEEVLKWLFKMFSFLIEKSLSWKLIGEFSLLHFILGFLLLVTLLELISFGFIHSGGDAEYIGNLNRKTRNNENHFDRRKYVLVDKKTGVVKE